MFSVLRLHIQHDASAASGDIWPFMILHHVVAFVLIFPLFMLLIYSLTGFYVYVTDKSRIKELAKTFEGDSRSDIFLSCLIFHEGCIICLSLQLWADTSFQRYTFCKCVHWSCMSDYLPS